MSSVFSASLSMTELLPTERKVNKSHELGHVAQTVAHLTHESLVQYPVWPHTFVSPSLIQEGQLSVTGKSMCMK